MANILNPFNNESESYIMPNYFYDDNKVKKATGDRYHNYDIDNFVVDNSEMNKDIEDNLVILQKKATSSLSQRKRHYDFKTKNRSFVDLYNDWYKMGIKNNKFHLAIYDTDLIGIDPYSPIMPVDLQLKIILECFINPWYWLREVCRIPASGMPIEVGGGVPFEADRNNISSWYLFLNGIDHYDSKPRQTGKTQNAVAQYNYTFHFGTLSSTILFFNKDQAQATENLGRLKDQRDMMPRWMQMRTLYDDETGKVDKGTDNIRSYKCPVTGNAIKVMSKATSKDAAVKMGRGATAPLQYLDEFDFMPFNIEILNAAAFAYNTAADTSRKYGVLYGRCLTSTPGDLDTRDGEAAAKFIDRCYKWKDRDLDEPINKLKRILADPSNNGWVYVEHSWRQLKKSIKWYENACALVDYNEEQILREIELKRMHGSDNSPFKRSAIMYITNNQKTPIDRIDFTKTLTSFNIYKTIKPNVPYIFSVDPSEGLMQDNNAVTLINPYTKEVHMEFRSPYISQKELYNISCKFLDIYCPRALIVIENNKGRELINYFMDSKYRYNLYYDDSKLLNVSELVDKYGAVVQSSNERRAFGLSTTRSNRPVYFSILENIMEEQKDLVNTEFLVNDVCGLIRKPNGRVEAGSTSHDDNIMSYLMGLYIIYNAPDELLNRYGIVRGQSEEYLYDDNGNLTEEATIRKMQEMLNEGLPDELAQIVQETLSQRDQLQDTWDYYTEVDKMQKEAPKLPSMMTEAERMQMGNTYVESASPLDNSFWRMYDEQIMESNDINKSASFNIEDFLD